MFLKMFLILHFGRKPWLLESTKAVDMSAVMTGFSEAQFHLRLLFRKDRRGQVLVFFLKLNSGWMTVSDVENL